MFETGSQKHPRRANRWFAQAPPPAASPACAGRPAAVQAGDGRFGLFCSDIHSLLLLPRLPAPCLVRIFSGAQRGGGALAPLALPAVFHMQVRPPAKPGACVSPSRAYCRQASQEALNARSPASFAPPPVNGGSSRCVLQFFGIEYYPASPGTDGESLFTLHGTAGGYRFAKTNKTGAGCLFVQAARAIPASFPRRSCARPRKRAAQRRGEIRNISEGRRLPSPSVFSKQRSERGGEIRNLLQGKKSTPHLIS